MADRDRDILVFDPVHCYGLPGYLQIIRLLEKRGWPRGAFWPHGGHPFCLHVVAALGLGGAEVNPLCFQPFGGYGDETNIANGAAIPPELPGIGFERKPALRNLFATLVDV
jgi:L-alanine-DL-glutamate epimerase-like enolase superfamily enzyme